MAGRIQENHVIRCLDQPSMTGSTNEPHNDEVSENEEQSVERRENSENDHVRIRFGGWRHGHTNGDNCERWNDTGSETDNSDDDDDDDESDDCDSFYEGVDEDTDDEPIVSFTNGGSPPTMTYHGRNITLVCRPWDGHVRRHPCLHMQPL